MMKEKLNKVLTVWLCVVMFATVFSVAVPLNDSANTANNSIEYDYVIITTNDIIENSEELEHFIHMKEFCGHSVKVVTESDFLGLTGQYPNERADKIRKWLIDNYQTLDIEYVLFIGDSDPDDTKDPNDHVGDIPMKMGWPKYFKGGTGAPTDLYYGDLDSNWDLDGDGFYYELKDYDSLTSPDPSIASDTFSVFWTGEVMCDYDIVYTFRTLSDDGVQLMIDGIYVIDNWDEHDLMEDKAVISLTAGKHDISLFFRENYGDGIIKLYWRNFIDKSEKIIPNHHLYDADGNVGGLTGFYYDNNDFTDYKFTRVDPEISFEWGTGDIGLGHPDLEAEVYVGRIPVYDSDYEQLDAILRKMIDYETDPGDISWRESILLPMARMDSKTTSTGLGEAIKQFIAMPNGFSYYRIYEKDFAPPTPELWPCEYETVWNEWKNGYGMVTWHTHGGEEHASHVIHRDNLSHLDDSKPAFTFQGSCHNACPENKNNLAYSLLKHGGIAMVAGTRMTTYITGDYSTFTPTKHYNHQMAFYYTHYIIDKGMSAGMALNEVLIYHSELSPNAIRYNLYGDPDCYLLTTVPNYPPVADANGPYEVDEGSPAIFNASDSYDPEGDPLEYRWDFENDDVWDTDWSTNPTASYTWGDDHLGLVKVEVRDKLGFTANDTGSVIVYNVAPTITNLTMDQSNPQFILPYVHDLMFEGSFTDPGWLDTHTATWNFGDGTIVSGTLIEENNEPNATGTTTADHVYSAPGIYTVTLTVTDDDGGIGSDTMIVIVVDEFEALQDIDDYIQNLDDSFFKGNPTQRKNAFKKMIAAVHNLLVVEEYEGAIRNLRYNIRAKADGYVDGNPKNDWIIDPTAQAEICMKIDDLTAYLEYLDSQS